MASSVVRRSLFSLVDHAAKTHPLATAIRSPFQQGTGLEELSYSDLHQAGLRVAGRLVTRIGKDANNKSNGTAVGKPIVAIVSDLPNTVENLLLQLACSRLNVAYATVKDAKMLAEFNDGSTANFVHGIPAGSDSWLAQADTLKSTLAEELFKDLGSSSPLGADEYYEGDASGQDSPHACFNTVTKPMKEAELALLGADALEKLALSPADKVCVSITLCHPFGIGSGVSSVFSAGSTLVLPAVGGIRSCGVPSERAEACLRVLKEEKCSVLFSDAPIIKQMGVQTEGELDLPDLRTGVVKTGSGSDFLEEKLQFAGKELWTMGKKQ